MACCNRTKGYGFKLKDERFRVGKRKKFFMLTIVKHWHRLPRETLDAISSGLDSEQPDLLEGVPAHCREG